MKENDIFERLLFVNIMSKSSSLAFTVEQWELTRRLRNTGLTKEQVCQAFDDLEKMEKDLSDLFSLTHASQLAMNANGEQLSSSLANTDMTLTNASTIVNNYFANLLSPTQETREVDEFKK